MNIFYNLYYLIKSKSWLGSLQSNYDQISNFPQITVCNWYSAARVNWKLYPMVQCSTSVYSLCSFTRTMGESWVEPNWNPHAQIWVGLVWVKVGLGPGNWSLHGIWVSFGLGFRYSYRGASGVETNQNPHILIQPKVKLGSGLFAFRLHLGVEVENHMDFGLGSVWALGTQIQPVYLTCP